MFFRLDVTRTGGVDSAMAIQRAAQKHLTSLIPKVCESDMEVAELERQVNELKAKILEQQVKRIMRVNSETCERIAKVKWTKLIFQKEFTLRSSTHVIFRMKEVYFFLNLFF